MSVQPVPAGPRAAAGALEFPPGFVWGAATAAFQVEGSTTADGRTESIWDAFCRQPGRVVGGDTGEPGADHYLRMRSDVALMRELGLGAYRFSIAWPRVRPDGGGPNHRGIAFYDALVDELLDNGITPVATLYHWDLPQALEDAGGWTSRDTAARFAEYADTATAVLGDRVSMWTTLNEPWCSAFLGYGSGVHAPGRTDPAAALAAAHHLLLAHGLAVPVIRSNVPGAVAGITLNLFPVLPASPSAADADAARRVDALQNRLFLDPVLRGGYPPDLLSDVAHLGFAEHVRPGDAQVIAAPVDFVGVNFYRDHHVAAGGAGERAGGAWPGSEHLVFPPRGLPVTAAGWEIRAEGLRDLLVDLDRGYPGVTWYVTENGAAFDDRVEAGQVFDHDRRDYLEGHLRAAHAAIAAGVDLRGYFAWSLLDNFEWAEGYAKRFGIVHVDYATQARAVKLSGRWYAKVAAENRVPGGAEVR
ncbi:GH1 family beta-glucosidase [Actinokineospora bangkokensis]|uniref:Beta-glucosidase n=1 Tax=Actinokineospora bangkokensis TaxID=1193682 RepID=A0A1Q9LQT7_9PSEU|nr:GH1 family beta-glucosidase [Actinokineospora bangkokensis]OLR94364.1 beta-glucosidase [Actinokineospora bangkokensis]